jgi:peptidoglycan/xylan/chitin deacetylase (PgdA/CDA1 family)
MLPSQSDLWSAPAPRHAARDEADNSGRHRRPESLADITRPRPVPVGAPPSADGPVDLHVADDSHPADEIIRQARRAAGRIQYAAEAAARRRFTGGPPAEQARRAGGPPAKQACRADGPPAEQARRADGPPAEQTRRAGGPPAERHRRAGTSPARRNRRAGARPAPDATGLPFRGEPPSRPSRHAAGRPGDQRRGKHAMPAEHDPLGITVRPIRIGAVRDWAVDTGDRPPVTGVHRAPGTLPIESWLLVGKGRQQALLAGVVAVGLALVMIPTAAQRTDDVDPVTAAGSRTVTAAPSTAAPAAPPEAGDDGGDSGAGQPQRPDRPAKPAPATPAPPDATPPSGAVTSAPPEPPLIEVPPGDGPHRSLRTTGSAAVALTFDDGPDPVQTPRILALLEQYQVKAVFCLIGAQVERHPEIVRQIVAAGHTLCNHTWDHSLVIGTVRPADIEADLARTDAAIRRAVPDAQIPFFRAPGGNFTDRLVQVAYRSGMTSLYWDVDPRDWEHRPDEDDAQHVERLIADVQKFVKPGSIVLSHDFNQPDTVQAYETLLPYLTENFTVGMPARHPAPADS